jgi:hypothetical protein
MHSASNDVMSKGPCAQLIKYYAMKTCGGMDE